MARGIIGDSVFEPRDSDERAWYRVIYLAGKKDVLFVLDCFGIKYSS